MKYVDLNSDLGESFGAYTIGMDSAIIPQVTSVNVACGFHAGDPVVMDSTVAMALKHGAAIGAHPGFPDLQGFGRRNMTVTPQEAYAMTLYQLGALDAFVKAHGGRIQHCKPHGSLYNMAAKDAALADAICKACRDFDPEMILLGLSGSQFGPAAQRAGIPFAAEFFADRAYNDDGSLVNRKLPGAVIHDPAEAVARVLQMAKEGTVTTITGNTLQLGCASVCVHGDNEAAVELVKSINEALAANGVQTADLKTVLAHGD